MNGCTGQCCERFCMPIDPTADDFDPARYDDGAQIAAMVIELEPEPKGSKAWTCRHFDTESRRCGIYEDRPAMCRRYPNDGTCGYCGHVEIPRPVGTVFPCNAGVFDCGNGWMQMPDGTKAHGPGPVVEWFRNQAATR